MMFNNFFKKMRHFSEWLMSFTDTKFATPILCTVSFTESSFFLIPPDIFLIAMGAHQPKKALTYAHFCTFFSVLGGLFGYLLGFMFWSAFQDYFFAYIATQEQFETVQSLFQANTFTAILLAAFTPIPFKVFTVLGGVLHAPLIPFILGAIIGRGLRYYTIGLLFFIFGEKIRFYIEKHFERVTLIFGIALIIIITCYYLL